MVASKKDEFNKSLVFKSFNNVFDIGYGWDDGVTDIAIAYNNSCLKGMISNYYTDKTDLFLINNSKDYDEVWKAVIVIAKKKRKVVEKPV